MTRATMWATVVLLTSTPVLATVGGGDVTLKVKGAKDVVFSHEAHVDGVGNQCTECHPKPFTDSAAHRSASMKQMREGASCGACHNGRRAFSVKGECARCHNA
jgi:c(7)-type cytochrome triheme protein